MSIRNDGGSTATIAEIRDGGTPVTAWAVLDADTGTIVSMGLPSIPPGEMRFLLVNTGGVLDLGVSFYDADQKKIASSWLTSSDAMGSIAMRFSLSCKGDASKCPNSIR